jgi:hypothetical protein
MQEEDSLIGRTIRDKYVIVRRLGEGGMGRVYLAELESIRDRKFAVKLLKPELTNDPGFRQRFQDEARHQAQLDHENIVQMVDYFHVRDDYFLVLDYVDGEPLSDLIDGKGGKGLPEKQALSIMVGMLSGLDCAHQKGIVHRDVKPSNVLIDSRGRVRITDFGIAMEASGLTHTSEGRLIGTPEYMSPEQLSNSGQIDHRSDVYSAGIVLYEMLTGQPPFHGSSFQAIQAQQMTSAVPNPRAANPKIPKRLADIVRRALQKSPADRFQGGPHFIAAIESYRRRGAWKYLLVSACVLIAAGVYVAQSMYVSMQVIRQAVQTASHDYDILCREQGLMKADANAKRTADDQGESDLSDIFAKKIEESRANMQASEKEYAGIFEKMTKFNQWTVRHVLSEADPVPETALARKLMASDYETFVASGKTPGVASMIARCGGLGYKMPD